MPGRTQVTGDASASSLRARSSGCFAPDKPQHAAISEMRPVLPLHQRVEISGGVEGNDRGDLHIAAVARCDVGDDVSVVAAWETGLCPRESERCDRYSRRPLYRIACR